MSLREAGVAGVDIFRFVAAQVVPDMFCPGVAVGQQAQGVLTLESGK